MPAAVLTRHLANAVCVPRDRLGEPRLVAGPSRPHSPHASPRRGTSQDGGAAPWILGLGGSHNGGACLLKGDEIVVAIQEERLSGVKRDWTWLADASLAVSYCLDAAGIDASQLDAIAVSALPSARDPRHDVSRHPILGEAARHLPVLEVGHHLAHAAGAHALSGFPDAAVLVIDGSGNADDDLPPPERAAIVGPPGSEAISIYQARGTHLRPLVKYTTGPAGWLGPRRRGMRTFSTLGAMYSAVAEQIFGDIHAAGKVMGLAPCGRPSIPADEFLVADQGRLRFTGDVARRFPHDDRWPAREEEYVDLAASVQAALEAGLDGVMDDLTARAGPIRRLSYAGGVALNVVANERVVRPRADELFVLPAAEDSGIALGAAYAALWRSGWRHHPRPRLRRDSLGRSYDERAVEAAARRVPGVAVRPSPGFLRETCERLAAGQVVGWFHDGAELGPRSLGQRSLLCDPRRADAKARLNARVKYREAFRPFAPVLPRERAAEWFEEQPPPHSPFMLAAAVFRPERAPEVPAVVHVDGTGRLQTVDADDHPLLHRLLREWEDLTGVPVLLNTSFNLAGEPIVETPEDALRCLLSSGIDACVIGGMIAERHPGVSILDLRPRLAARPDADGSNAFSVETPWGQRTVSVRPDDHRVATAADGSLSARELGARSLPAACERTTVQLMHRLWRLRILAFDAPRLPQAPLSAVVALPALAADADA